MLPYYCNQTRVSKFIYKAGNTSSSFTRLGTLQDDYEIQVKQDAQPFSFGTARNIPLPLCDKVKQELDAMEAQGVISKVQQPNP